MQDLPEFEDLSVLPGKQLHQVCIGLHEVILHFDGGELQMLITTGCAYIAATGTLHQIGDQYAANASLICELIDSWVTAVRTEDEGTVVITFSNGAKFSITRSPEFESFIRNGRRVIVL